MVQYKQQMLLRVGWSVDNQFWNIRSRVGCQDMLLNYQMNIAALSVIISTSRHCHSHGTVGKFSANLRLEYSLFSCVSLGVL